VQVSLVTTGAPEPSATVAIQVEAGIGAGTPQTLAEGQGTAEPLGSPDSPTLPVDPEQQASPPPPVSTAAPTATPRPTKKPAPTRTSRPTVNTTKTPSLLPPPALDEPEDGETISDNDTVTLSWQWSQTLGQDEHFDVLVWREGGDHQSVAWVRESFYPLHIPSQEDRLTEPDLKGTYYWSVVVIHGQTAEERRVLSEESVTRTFVWLGNSGGDDDDPEEEGPGLPIGPPPPDDSDPKDPPGGG
jgi:hypothetical protein